MQHTWHRVKPLLNLLASPVWSIGSLRRGDPIRAYTSAARRGSPAPLPPQSTYSDAALLCVAHRIESRSISAGGGGGRGSDVVKRLNALQAGNARDAAARMIYSRTFNWLEQQINQFLNGDEEDASALRHIGLLDIFGFERFEKNSLEQLCINFVC